MLEFTKNTFSSALARFQSNTAPPVVTHSNASCKTFNQSDQRQLTDQVQQNHQQFQHVHSATFQEPQHHEELQAESVQQVSHHKDKHNDHQELHLQLPQCDSSIWLPDNNSIDNNNSQIKTIKTCPEKRPDCFTNETTPVYATGSEQYTCQDYSASAQNSNGSAETFLDTTNDEPRKVAALFQTAETDSSATFWPPNKTDFYRDSGGSDDDPRKQERSEREQENPEHHLNMPGICRPSTCLDIDTSLQVSTNLGPLDDQVRNSNDVAPNHFSGSFQLFKK